MQGGGARAPDDKMFSSRYPGMGPAAEDDDDDEMDGDMHSGTLLRAEIRGLLSEGSRPLASFIGVGACRLRGCVYGCRLCVYVCSSAVYVHDYHAECSGVYPDELMSPPSELGDASAFKQGLESATEESSVGMQSSCSSPVSLPEGDSWCVVPYPTRSSAIGHCQALKLSLDRMAQLLTNQPILLPPGPQEPQVRVQHGLNVSPIPLPELPPAEAPPPPPPEATGSQVGHHAIKEGGAVHAPHQVQSLTEVLVLCSCFSRDSVRSGLRITAACARSF